MNLWQHPHCKAFFGVLLEETSLRFSEVNISWLHNDTNLKNLWLSAWKDRGRRPEVFCKKGVLTNFVKFTGKDLWQSLCFNKVAGLEAATILKKRLLHRCFPVNFVKFVRTPFYRTPPASASGKKLQPNLWFIMAKLYPWEPQLLLKNISKFYLS